MNSVHDKIAVLFLHPACNMTCSYCITDSTIDTMRFDQAVEAIQIAESLAIRNLVLGGGEPFAWPHDTVRLARWAKSRDHYIQVGTNGIAMPDPAHTADCIDRHVLPLDSADPVYHNEARKAGDGHHALILARLETLRQTRSSVTVSTVVTARNAAHVAGLADFLNQYVLRGGALHAWHLYKFIPEGRGGQSNARALDIGESSYDYICAEAKSRSNGYRVYKRKDMRHSRYVEFLWFEKSAIKIGSEVWAS